MKKTFKTCIATLMAMATLMTGFTGVITSAAETDNSDTSIIIEEPLLASSKDFSFSGVGSGGIRCTGTITITTSKRVYFYFGCCSVGKAHIAVMNNSNNNECGSFNIPAISSGTLSSSVYLDPGTYYFYVTPDGCNSTTGGFSVSY